MSVWIRTHPEDYNFQVEESSLVSAQAVLVIQPNDGWFRLPNSPLPPEHFDLAEGLYVGKIDHETANVVLDFGNPDGYNLNYA